MSEPVMSVPVPVPVPLTFEVCFDLGMTARDAAVAMGYAFPSSAYFWAGKNGKIWPQKSEPKVQVEDLPPIEPAEVRAIDCRRLWVSVLAQEWHFAFCDAQSGNAHLWRRQARAWFGSADFCEVCDYAGFNPVAVMARFRAKLGSEGVAA